MGGWVFTSCMPSGPLCQLLSSLAKLNQRTSSSPSGMFGRGLQAPRRSGSSQGITPGSRVWVVPKDPSSGRPGIPLGGLVCGVDGDENSVALGVPPNSGLGAAPVVRVRCQNRPSEFVQVSIISVSKQSIRFSPLTSWGANYLEFSADDLPNIFNLIGAVNTLEEAALDTPHGICGGICPSSSGSDSSPWFSRLRS